MVFIMNIDIMKIVVGNWLNKWNEFVMYWVVYNFFFKVIVVWNLNNNRDDWVEFYWFLVLVVNKICVFVCY